MDKNFQFIIFQVANKWLLQNPERLTDKEKLKFKSDLFQYFTTNGNSISDEVFDFFISSGLINYEDRHTEFLNYLKKKYINLSSFSILDVGSGRMCHLSEKLAKRGAKVVAMDPSIRLNNKEVLEKKIMAIKKELFICDQFAKNSSGTNIYPYDIMA